MVVDGGSLFWKDARLDGARAPQQLEKARLQAEAYGLLGLDAFLPAASDLSLGPDVALGLLDGAGLPLLGGNLTCGERTLDATRVVERGDRKVGLFGVVGGSVPAGCSTTSAVDTARAAVGSLQAAGVDVVIGLVNGDPGLERRLDDEVEGVDFIVGAGARQTFPQGQQLEHGTWQLSAGSRGRQVGRAELTWVPGGAGWTNASAAEELADRIQRAATRTEQARGRVEAASTEDARNRARETLKAYERQLAQLEADRDHVGRDGGRAQNTFRHLLVDLDAGVGEHEATQALVGAAKPRIEAAATAVAPSYPPVKAYMGTAVCASCHSDEAAQWRQTPHARAFATLVEVGRANDLDCFACHVTGAHDAQGPQHPSQVGELVDVGCESCHDSGAHHVADPTAPGRITRKPEVSTCTQCHDGVKDEGRFDLAAYWPQVVHQAAE